MAKKKQKMAWVIDSKDTAVSNKDFLAILFNHVGVIIEMTDEQYADLPAKFKRLFKNQLV